MQSRHCLTFVMWLLAVSLAGRTASAQPQTEANPQDPPTELLKNDSNPTRPVLFSLRPEFYRPGPGVTRASLVFRYDLAALRKRRFLPGKRGIILRFELPIAEAHVRGTPRRAGLGDAYGQVLLAPHFTRTGAFVIGTGLLVPSASDTLLGTGKWVLAPAAAPVWFLGERRMFFVKFQNFVSVGGDSSKPDINYLLITPTFLHRRTDRWWVLGDLEMKTNWLKNGRTGVKSGFQIGRGLSSAFGVWTKPELWWGNQDRGWNLKFGLVWYR